METTFGTRLAALRATRQMTQEELSFAAGVSRGRIAVIEKACGSLPHGTTIARLAKALGVSAHVLLGEANEQFYEQPGPAPQPAPCAVPPELMDKMLAQISDQRQRHGEQLTEAARQHRAELTATKREARVQAERAAKFLEYTIDTMKDTIAELKQQIYGLQLTAGQRMPTPEEQAYFDAQAAAQKKGSPAGFKNYDNQPVSYATAA